MFTLIYNTFMLHYSKKDEKGYTVYLANVLSLIFPLKINKLSTELMKILRNVIVQLLYENGTSNIKQVMGFFPLYYSIYLKGKRALEKGRRVRFSPVIFSKQYLFYKFIKYSSLLIYNSNNRIK